MAISLPPTTSGLSVWRHAFRIRPSCLDALACLCVRALPCAPAARCHNSFQLCRGLCVCVLLLLLACVASHEYGWQGHRGFAKNKKARRNRTTSLPVWIDLQLLVVVAAWLRSHSRCSLSPKQTRFLFQELLCRLQRLRSSNALLFFCFSFTRVKQISSEPHNICIKNAPPRHNLRCMLNKCKCKFSYEFNSQTIMFSQGRAKYERLQQLNKSDELAIIEQHVKDFNRYSKATNPY